MRYFTVPHREGLEAELIPQRFGKVFAPVGEVTLSAGCRLDRAGTELVGRGDRTLAVHADSGSWAFLDPSESSLLERCDGRPLAEAGLTTPGERALIGRLWRRGLLSIDGQRAADATMFDDSPNYDEGHLVELLVTEKCNLACGYCLAGANPAMPAMSDEIALRTVDRAFAMRNAGAIAFEFSGGEPLLRFDLLKRLVNYTRHHPARGERRIYFSIQSNATLLDREKVAWIKDNEIRIGISFDGQPWAQNLSRPMVNGKPSFHRLINGIDHLQQAGVPFGALVVLNRSNIASSQALIEFLLDNDIRSLKLNPVAFLGTARGDWDRFGLSEDEIITYFRDFIEQIVTHRYPIVEANVVTMLRHLTSKQRSVRCLRGQCGAGDTFQAVSASGDIYPCGRATQTPAMRLGHVLDAPTESLAAPADSHPLIKELRARRPQDLEGCNTCAYRQFCQAGCSAQAFERYGTVRHRTPECAFFKTLYPWLMERISHDPQAFATLDALGYFGAPGKLVVDHHDLH